MTAKRSSALRLHGEIVYAPLDLWLAHFVGDEAERDVHFYVGDRYWRLADYYEHVGWKKLAKRFRLQAEHYLRLSGWNDSPPAIALAMGVPRPPIFTMAIGRRANKPPPADAA
jgi:hypothetical protein